MRGPGGSSRPLGPHRCHALQASDRPMDLTEAKSREWAGAGLQICAGSGNCEKTHRSPPAAALPSAGPSRGCCHSKAVCHGHDCAAQERAGQLLSAGLAQPRPALPTHGGLRSSAGAPSGLWSPLSAETPTGSLPLFMASRQPCCLPALVLPKARGGACELVAGDAPQWASELAGPSLCEQRRVCAQAWPGSPSPPGLQAFLGTEDRNQPCLFQAARLLRNSRLRPETPSPAQPWPLSEKRVPVPPPTSLLFSDEGEGSGEGLRPRPSPTPAPSCLMSECRSWGVTWPRALGTCPQ